MKLLALILCFFVTLVFCDSSQSVSLEDYKSSTPTKITNVLDGSKLYMASADGAAKLSKITVTSNGQSKQLQTLLNDFDANGFLNGFPVNSDLTISTTNSEDVTSYLNGYLFISSPDMAKDPNFLVYAVSNQVKSIDRSNYNETTIVLLNERVEKTETDPDFKPLYCSRIDGINQLRNTHLYIYHDIPGDGYTNDSYSYKKLIFKNPLGPLPSPNLDTIFFDNIEPIQFTLRRWHIRAVGGGISFTVSREWKDSTTYQTTKETTTGYTMSQRNIYSSNVTFKYTPGHDGASGYMINTADMGANMTVTRCNDIDCQTEAFPLQVYADSFYDPRNDTVLRVDVDKKTEYGSYYLQYFRIEGNVNGPATSTSVAPASSTTAAGSSTAAPETTTKSVASTSTRLAILLMIIKIL